MQINNFIFISSQNMISMQKPFNYENLSSKSNNRQVLATLLKNIEDLGFTFNKKIIKLLEYYTIDELDIFYQNISEILIKEVGADKGFEPMYKNFPKQVMEMSISELYINAILHYFGDHIGIRILPDHEKEERYPLVLKYSKLRVIGYMDLDELDTFFSRIMSSNTSLSLLQVNELVSYIEMKGNEIKLPKSITYKEILAVIAGAIIKFDINCELKNYFTNANDILRIAVYLSDGDVSLASKTKFISFKRKVRKYLLELIENLPNKIEDMQRYCNFWIRLGERLHPGEFKDKYPKAVDAFTRIRNGNFIPTYNAKVERAIIDRDLQLLIELLVKKPTVFARRLSEVLRVFSDYEYILKNFHSIISKISIPVLLQLSNFFKNISVNRDYRIFFPKGSIAKVFVRLNDIEKLDLEISNKIVYMIDSALLSLFSQKDKIGKVYIDPILKNYLIPFSQRSASQSMRTLVRGSRISLPDGNIVRFFIYWKNSDQRIDIDLSVAMFDKDWNSSDHISYTNLVNTEKGMAHSGDITSAPNGASEFIDLDLNSIIKSDDRYAVMNVFSFTKQPFDLVPDLICGWMMRDNLQSGEIFEVKTVKDKMNITSKSTVSIPLIIDIVDKSMIWMDLSLNRNKKISLNNVEDKMHLLTLIGREMSSVNKSTLYDLFKFHATSRGNLVDKINEADIVFSLDGDITPFDNDIIISEYLSN